MQGLLLHGGTIQDGAGRDAVLDGATADLHLQIDTVAPTVTSLNLAGSTPNNASSESFTLVFSESVTGVDSSDFTAVASGTAADTGITVTGSGNIYTVTVNGVTGDGTLGLNLKGSGTGIADAAGNAVSGGFTGGVYTVDHTPPTVSSITALGASPNNANSDQYLVVFSESVTGVVAGDFALTTTNTPGGTALSDTGISSSTGGGTTYTVTIGGVAGDGTLRLDLKSNDIGITDAAGNGATAGYTGGDVYTVDNTAPAAPTLALAHDNADLNHDKITNDPTITVTPAESGGILLYKIDGATSFSATAPSFATDGSADGPHTVAVKQQDAAGNIGAAASLTFTLDTIAPAAPTLALAHDTGISGTDHITRDPSITYSTLAVGDHFLYKVDTGSFSANVPIFADGAHTLSVQEVDTAGNVSAASSLTFTLDTTAPDSPAITASPGSGSVFAGSTVELTLGFKEAVHITGGTPELTLNDGGTALYDATATALLGDASKLVFDHLVSASLLPTPALAVTGFVGATIDDLAGNHAVLSNVAAAFSALAINETFAPAYTVGGMTRPQLELDASGHIILDAAAAAVAANYGFKFLYLGMPASTPYPPVADLHHDFHLL